ncbi:hypothetical protein [Nocardioides sp. SYSU DS0651]|uniref:hypothetical protein n=1 Tax=Nocardioides sp. SYSU DS0651 TaxID=3415955 RepID=UPI003F4BDB1F
MNRRTVPAILLAAALLAGGCSPDEYVAPPPEQQSEVARPAAAGATVAFLQEAVSTGDVAAARDLGSDDRSRELLGAVAANAREIGLSDVTFRYVTETGRTGDAGAWDALVAVTWRVDGFDEEAARVEVPFSFAAGGSRIAGIGAPGQRLPIWLDGPVVVRRPPGAVVVGQGPPEEMARYARWARVAVADVRAALRRPARLVVEIPEDVEGLHDALGVAGDEYATIAAVTAPVDGSRTPESPVHVFVNPAVYDDLDPVAAQVVMTHEAVHAATGAALAEPSALWLVEGFADYIALRDLDLPLSRTAGQIIKQVRTDGLPDALPSEADFATSSGHLGSVYEAAWLACVTLAEHRGREALVGLYDAVIGGGDLERELRKRFDWSLAELTAAWRSTLADVADVADVPAEAP